MRNKGCAGMSYHLEYVEKPERFDEIVEQDGVKVIVDSKALFSIIGSEMDWQEDALQAKFVFKSEFRSSGPHSGRHAPPRFVDRNRAEPPLYFLPSTQTLISRMRAVVARASSYSRRTLESLPYPLQYKRSRTLRRTPTQHDSTREPALLTRS